MAQIMQTAADTLVVTLTLDEQDTAARVLQELEAYLTLWLHDRLGNTLRSRFEKLTPQSKSTILTTLTSEESKSVA